MPVKGRQNRPSEVGGGATHDRFNVVEPHGQELDNGRMTFVDVLLG